jgi:YidC/Oxa1 family membrane protein insertase
MDKNSLLGIVAFVGFFALWLYLFPPSQQKSQKPAAADTSSSKQKAIVRETEIAPSRDSMAVIDTAQAPALTAQLDSAAQQKAQQAFGPFLAATQGHKQTIQVLTPKLKLNIDTKGGFIRSAVLNTYKTYGQQPLPIIPDNPQNSYSLELIAQGQGINLNDLYFKPSVSQLVLKDKEQQTLSLKADLGAGKSLEHRYTFFGNEYRIDHQLVLINLQQDITGREIELKQQLNLIQTEKSLEKMMAEATIYYKNNTDDEIDKLDISNDEISEERELKYLKWICFKTQFFNTSIIAKDKFESSALRSKPLITEKQASANQPYRTFTASMFLPYAGKGQDTVQLSYFLGPNDVSQLQKLDVNLEKIVSLGWGPLRYIALGILWIFKLLESFISNYGIIIFLLAVFIKVITFPMSHKSTMSQAKMQVVNELPEIQKLNEEYKDKPTELSQRKMAFYSQLGINPMGGCIPLLLQFPILIAMFNFFPHSIELRQQPFLWAEDLSTYDSVLNLGFSIPFYGDHVSLFCLLMTISTLLYTYLQQRQQGPVTDPNMQPLKYMGYIMPVFFMGFLNNYAAALSYYYLVFNILTIGITFATAKLLDKEKLRAKFNEMKNNKKPTKKGGMMKWLEEQQKAQEQLRRQRSQQPKNKRGR